MKETLSEKELRLISGSHHGGLKFALFTFKGAKMFQCYRAHLSGGLDYCNNQIEKMDLPVDAGFTVRIYERTGLGRNQWEEIAYLERTKETMFNH